MVVGGCRSFLLLVTTSIYFICAVLDFEDLAEPKFCPLLLLRLKAKLKDSSVPNYTKIVVKTTSMWWADSQKISYKL